MKKAEKTFKEQIGKSLDHIYLIRALFVTHTLQMQKKLKKLKL